MTPQMWFWIMAHEGLFLTIEGSSFGNGMPTITKPSSWCEGNRLEPEVKNGWLS